MPKKLTQQEVEQIFIDGGGTFDDEYIDSTKKYKYTCGCGYKSKIKIYEFKENKGCKNCSQKYTYKYVFDYFKYNGCILITKFYINNKQKLNYICKCGNNSEIIFASFIKSGRCRKCAGNKKYTYEYVYNYFKDQGCELLEKEYIGCGAIMKYKCNCGNISTTNFTTFKNGRRCKQCGTKRISEKTTYKFGYIKEYIEMFEYKLLSKEYKNAQTKILVECPKGHSYNVLFSSFKFGRRCRTCWYNDNSQDKNPMWNRDRTRKKRLNYLRFELRNSKLLSDDIKYKDYLTNKSLYEIDHIFPRVAFIDNNLDNIYDKKYIKEICNSRENLQILLKKDNISKNGKYNQEEFMYWFKSRPEYSELERIKEDRLVKEYANNQ